MLHGTANTAMRVHSLDGSTFLRELTHGRHLESVTSHQKSFKSGFRQSMTEEQSCQISS